MNSYIDTGGEPLYTGSVEILSKRLERLLVFCCLAVFAVACVVDWQYPGLGVDFSGVFSALVFVVINTRVWAVFSSHLLKSGGDVSDSELVAVDTSQEPDFSQEEEEEFDEAEPVPVPSRVIFLITFKMLVLLLVLYFLLSSGSKVVASFLSAFVASLILWVVAIFLAARREGH